MAPSRGDASLEARRPLLDNDENDSPRSSDEVFPPNRTARFRRVGRSKMDKKSTFTKAFVRLHLLCLFFAVGSFCWG